METFEDIESSSDSFGNSPNQQMKKGFRKLVGQRISEAIQNNQANHEVVSFMQRIQEDDIRRHYKELRKLVEQRKLDSEAMLLSQRQTCEEQTQQAVADLIEAHESATA